MAILASFSDFFLEKMNFAIFAQFGALHGRPLDPSSMFLIDLPFLHIFAFKQSARLILGSIHTFLMIKCKIF